MEENLDTTTQEDVETEGTEEAPKSAREMLMDEIDSKREESVKEDNRVMLEEAGMVAPPKQEEIIAVAEVPKTVKVKVDGEEIDVSYDEVLTNYQKTSAADKRLREAAAERTALDNYRNELIAFQEQLKTAPAEPAPIAVDANLQEALERAFEGETELAAQQIQKIIDAAKAQPSTPVMDEQKVMQAVEHKVAQIQYNSELNKANILFMEQYKDLNDDEILLELTTNQYNKLLSTGISPVEAVQKAGDATRNWMQSKTGKSDVVDIAARQELKKGITTLQQASAKTQSTVNDEPDDISSIISGMRKGRPSTNY